MITPFEMWFGFTFLPNLPNTISEMQFTNFMFLCICGFIYGISFVDKEFEKHISRKLLLKVLIPILLFIGVSLSITKASIPTEKQLAAIILVPAIVNNEKVQAIGNHSLDLLNTYLEQWVKDLVDEEVKGK